jgi:hypothetical protein
MKRKIFLALFSILALLLPLNLRGEVVDRIVALVNGEIITLSELEQMGKPFYDQVRQTSTTGEREEKMKKARIEVLDRLIDSRLLEEEMKKRKIEVPERDVDAAIQDVLKSSNLTENDMKKALAREGMTYSTYRQRVRDELGKMRLVSREIKSKIVIEDVVLRDYYQKNLEKFTDPLEVKIQQIFFPVPEHASQEETAAVEREARPILERARKGEDFAELSGTRDFVMMLAGERLRVALVTTHLPLSQVSGSLSEEKILSVIEITGQGLKKFWGFRTPRIAVTAFNPHAGEGGLFGKEEKIISRAVERARERGWGASGPWPADSLFYRAVQGEYDAVVCMYHDQGLIPLKLLHFDTAVNVTLGLPFIRTSVDHGVAYDIAGQGTASPRSMEEAIKLAAQMAVRKRQAPNAK